MIRAFGGLEIDELERLGAEPCPIDPAVMVREVDAFRASRQQGGRRRRHGRAGLRLTSCKQA
jgi:hypothetical protein